jgi:hypothetical protein
MIKESNSTYLTDIKPGKNCVVDITTTGGKKVKLIILPRDEAKYSYVFNIKGVNTLLLSKNHVFYDEVKDSLTMRSIDQAQFSFYTYPAIRIKNKGVHSEPASGIFSRYDVVLKPAAPIAIPFQQVSNDDKLKQYASSTETPLKPAYGINYVDTLPYKSYQLSLPKRLPANVYDLLATFNYQGNTAGLYANGKVIADDYYGIEPMPFSLRRYQNQLGTGRFVLQISPLMSKAGIYFEPGTDISFKDNTHAVLNSITVKPVYQVIF